MFKLVGRCNRCCREAATPWQLIGTMSLTLRRQRGTVVFFILSVAGFRGLGKVSVPSAEWWAGAGSAEEGD